MLLLILHLVFSVKERLNQVLTYKESPDVCDMQAARPRKVLILGSGGLSIGQAGEFDYSGSQVKSGGGWGEAPAAGRFYFPQSSSV